MPEPFTASSSVSWSLFFKTLLAVAGAIFALVLSGDISDDGKIQVNAKTVITVVSAVCLSLTGGAFIIETFGLEHMSISAQGFVMFVVAVLGLVFIGILYRSIELMNGKSLSEISREISSAYRAIVKGTKDE